LRDGVAAGAARVIRFHPITGEPLLLAPVRADRPNTFDDRETVCPFCPGHENETPPEIARVGEPWRLRVFPNKYPATDHHEVIVESPRHEGDFHALDDAVRLYAARYHELITRDGVRCVSLFKNHGPLAGASIEHVHSQIIGTGFVPPRVAREIEAFERAPACPLCAMPGVIIDENESFVWLAPHGSAMPYQQWIVPRAHANEMNDVDGLATFLERSASATTHIAPSFNWIFMNFAGAPRAHWYVELFPRLAMIAGFEIGSGSAINIIDPADAAAYFQRP
jgi:UDPglucose--hexose-1-phosphate uridylyltransferase